MRISDWSSDVCSSDLVDELVAGMAGLDGDYDAMLARHRPRQAEIMNRVTLDLGGTGQQGYSGEELLDDQRTRSDYSPALLERIFDMGRYWLRSEEHTSELQSLMRISYAVFCLKKKNTTNKQ